MKGKEKKNERGREESNSLSYKLNIIIKFTDRFKSSGNFTCKNNTSSYLLIFFYCNSFNIYQENIFIIVYR